MLPLSFKTEGEYSLDDFLHLLHTSPYIVYRIFYDYKYSAWCAVFIVKKSTRLILQLKLF